MTTTRRDTQVTVPLTPGAGAARLSFDNGLGKVELGVGTDPEDLLEARFGEPAPSVWTTDHTVHVEYPLGSRLLRRMRRNTVRLTENLPWSIDVHGGAERLEADLTGVDLRSVALFSGAAHCRLVLDRPAGIRTIRLASVKDFRIERPTGVPVRLEIAKGCVNVRLDGRRFGAVGGGLSDQTDGYDEDGDGYLVLVSGGVDGLTIS